MQRPLLLLAIIILGIGSILASIASISLAGDGPSRATTGAQEMSVLRYYEAVNSMVATGNPSALREILHPEMQDINLTTSVEGTRADIEAHVAFLHEIAPDAILAPDLVSSDGTRVQVYVEVRRDSASSALGFAFDETTPLWPPFEVFRVADGQIVERQSPSNGLASLETMRISPFSLGIPPRINLDVISNVFRPGAEDRFVIGDMPAILRLATGEISVKFSLETPGPALLLIPSPQRGSTRWERVMPGQTSLLKPGAILVVPPGSQFTARNPTAASANILYLIDGVSLGSAPDAGALASPEEHRVLSHVLASLTPAELAIPSEWRIGSAVLMPRSGLTVDPETLLIIAWPEDGPPQLYVRRTGCVDSGTANDESPDSAVGSLHCLTQSSESAFFNAGHEPARAWIVAVSSAPSAS